MTPIPDLMTAMHASTYIAGIHIPFAMPAEYANYLDTVISDLKEERDALRKENERLRSRSHRSRSVLLVTRVVRRRGKGM